MTFVLRESSSNDVESIQTLLEQAHKGITNLPSDYVSTMDKIRLSEESFQKSVKKPGNELYLFVLEEVLTKKILGLCAIKAKTGIEYGAPSRFFKKSFESHSVPMDGLDYTMEILSPIEYKNGPSEVCSLFLDKNERGRGAGSLLSLGRFLYIANEPHRITEEIIAELRGVITESGTSPFYEHLGRYFFHNSFSQALKMMHHFPATISELLPRHPIYIDLLHKDAQDVLGKTHIETEKAASLLYRIGFRPTHEFDLVDGGPKMAANRSTLHPIIESSIMTVHTIKTSEEPSTKAFISTISGPFRVTKGSLSFSKKEGCINITPDIQQALGVDVQEKVRIWIHPKV